MTDVQVLLAYSRTKSHYDASVSATHLHWDIFFCQHQFINLYPPFSRRSERDTTDQRIGPIDSVIAVVTELVNGSITWDEACQRLPAYDGVQAVE